MGLGRPRRAIGAIVSALFAIVLTVAVAGRDCRREDSEPVAAVHRFYAALRAEDHAAVLRMIGPRTQEQLRSAAQRLGEVAGGQKRYKLIEMLSIDKGAITAHPKVSLATRDGDAATVNVVVGGEINALTVVRVDGEWKLEL